MRARRWLAAFRPCLTVFLFCGLAPAQPIVTSVANAASFAFTAGQAPMIARGGIFSIVGAGTGGASPLQSTSFPLPTELNGATVEVTVNGVARNAILTYASSTQINAILPSDLPSDQGQLTVTYNGLTSAPFEVQVVDHFFGVFAIGSGGVGTAVVTDPLDANPNTWINLATRPAQPGEIWDIWGTGLGPIDSSDAEAAPLFDQTTVDVQVKVGGVPAQILFRGRSPCCAGLDQIRVVIPAGVQGCCVTLDVVVDGIVANSVGMSVSQDKRICSQSMFSQFFGDTDIEALLRRGKYSYGSFNAGRTVGYSSAASGAVNEAASASLQQADFVFAGCTATVDTTVTTTATPTSLPTGDCITTRFDYDFSVNPDFTVSASTDWEWAAFDKDGRFLDEVKYHYEYSSATVQPVAKPRLVEGLFAIGGIRSLDAGPSLNFTGAGGNYVLAKTPSPSPYFSYGWSQQQSFTGVVPPAVLQQGNYKMSAPGGADVAAFSVDFDRLAPVDLVNAADFAAPISLNQPLRFAWEGGSSAFTSVAVGGGSGRLNVVAATGSSSTTTAFGCTVDFAPKSYSVPVSVLQRLVPSDPALGSIRFAVASAKQVTVPGIDFATAGWADGYGIPATFVGGNVAAIRKPDQ